MTNKMNLSPEVELEDFVARPEKITAADIAAICQEAGMQAVRRNRSAAQGTQLPSYHPQTPRSFRTPPNLNEVLKTPYNTLNTTSAARVASRG